MLIVWCKWKRHIIILLKSKHNDVYYFNENRMNAPILCKLMILAIIVLNWRGFSGDGLHCGRILEVMMVFWDWGSQLGNATSRWASAWDAANWPCRYSHHLDDVEMTTYVQCRYSKNAFQCVILRPSHLYLMMAIADCIRSSLHVAVAVSSPL